MYEADYSWIISEKDYGYLKSNLGYVFFTHYLIKFKLKYDKGFELLETVLEIDCETESKLLNYSSIEELHILKFLIKKILISFDEIQK